MPIDEGLLNERVTIERENLVDNGKGGRKRPDGGPAWLPVAKVRAQCLPLRGGEALTSLVERSVQLWKVTIRAQRGLDTGMRLTWSDAFTGDIVANIKSLAVNEDRDGLVMTAESGRP